MERKRKKARHWFQNRHENYAYIQFAQYDSAMETQRPDESAMGTQTHISHKYFQLKSRHTVTGTFLKHIGKRESDRC